VEVRVTILAQSTSYENLDDLDELANAYAQAWTAAPAARRDRLRDDLICRCLPFANRMARRYAGHGEPMEDLQQVARIGLINAIDRYDPGRGSFTAFAVITVRGELKRHFRDKTWGLHVTRRMRDLCVDLRQATVALTTALQRDPTIEELARHLDVSVEQVRNARLCDASYTPIQLSTPIGTEGRLELHDALGDLDPNLELLTDKLTVAGLLQLLPTRIQRILTLRFYGNLTQSQIAAECDVSQMQVSRLLSRGLTWLRAAMVSDVPPPWIAGENVLYPDRVRIRIVPSQDAVTVRVSGEVDRDTADQLRLGLHSAVVAAAGGRLIIDVSGMPLADAAAVAVLRDSLRTAALAGVEVTVTAVQPQVAEVIATLGLA
jgi:RNA polymerase sigma-B factor